MGYVCIHGHFYQPPRENPWLEAIELQDSAYPYHDWNERIDAECYAPNSAARILNDREQILRILNNYEKISFNFGPTLLSWMEAKAPRVYNAILEADRASQGRFSGHGSAIAQAYHHIIMPLANRRDKYTQVAWGIRDFTFRFGRAPAGMWLPETAVDLETLEILAEFGIKFTILAPRQASKEGKIGGRSWKDVSGERIDPSMPYRLTLPSGKRISIFFYDGPISRAIAFEDVLGNGEGFAKRILAAFAEDLRPWPELVSVATDGETYGHHHRFGEMALAAALDYIEQNKLAQLTNFAEYLEHHPPIHRVEIFEDSSWSCVHGVERWRSNCGCNSGGHADWTQAWRAPLRRALDWLRDTLAPKYEEKAGQLLKDPWVARDDYIDVILERAQPDRAQSAIERFTKKHALRELSREESILTLKLLELQRHAMLMYTSCGWFFDELSGIETVQVVQYAGRVIELAGQVFGLDLESAFLEKLSEAKSNLAEHGDGARIYEKYVKPAVIDLPKVGRHYAVSSIFEPFDEKARLYCYTADRQQYFMQESERAKLVVGKAVFKSSITGESAALDFGVAHFGGQDVVAGVAASNPEVDGTKRLVEAFPQSSNADLRSLLKEMFGETHSLQALFKDQQRKILGILSNSVLAEVEAAHRQIYNRHAELMRFLISSGVPLPKGFRASAESALNSLLRDAFAKDELEPERIHSLLQQAKAVHIDWDASALEFALRRRIEAMAEVVVSNLADLPSIARLQKVVHLARSLPFQVNIWWVQTLCHDRIMEAYNEFLPKAAAGDADAQAWISQVTGLSEELSFSVQASSLVQSTSAD